MSYKRLTDKKIDLDKLSQKAKLKISDTYLEYAKINNALWELENKIINGTLIELPCNVGDTFYEVIKGMPIQEWEIETIIFNNVYFPKEYVISACRKKDLAHWKFWRSDFGKKIFITKAEAEKKLKELQKDD